MVGRRAIALALAAGFILAAPAAAQTVTVYSSLPLQGADRPHGVAIVRGIRLALAESGGRAGQFDVRYVSLDDSTAPAGAWTPLATSRNARRAAADHNTIAYIGDFNSGASAISIPILAERPIAQISPSNTANGLTVHEPAAGRGEPRKYYPLDIRNYVRLVPRATYEGGAVSALMGRRGCRRAALVSDAEVYGESIAYGIRRFARRHGVRLVVRSRLDSDAPSLARLARRIRASRARCVAFAGITINGAVELFRRVHRVMPRALFFGGAGIAESGFTDPREGGVPARIGRRTRVVTQELAPDAYPPAGRAFFDRYARRYGGRAVDPWAIYGYESMRLVLDGVAALGPLGSDRSALISQLFATRDRDSVLGRYSFDANGDTSLVELGAYRVTRGGLRFVSVVRPLG
jgi:branched-chain amino acid transport system substrate-binding protein